MRRKRRRKGEAGGEAEVTKPPQAYTQGESD